MAPELELAVAQLDLKGIAYNDLPNLDQLKAQYPELTFVFNALEDAKEELSEQEHEMVEVLKDHDDRRVQAEELKEEVMKICKIVKANSKNAPVLVEYADTAAKRVEEYDLG